MVTDPKTGMIVNISHYPKGYKMGWHKHSCAHGMYIIEGAMETNLGIVKKGEFVWFPAGVEMDHGAPVVGTMDALGDRSHLARGRLLDLDVGDDSPLGECAGRGKQQRRGKNRQYVA